ncbi:hypothetical protein NPIL_330611 [Nephila pilipes]|uniref:Uncharacterized protein n=1 Tax=Nephila pilipes TaxID=299642 RepID=A0A8X6NHS4_NEPPI|nr:hypothetical protein NPIL_330611 [Nephila pilipes]
MENLPESLRGIDSGRKEKRRVGIFEFLRWGAAADKLHLQMFPDSDGNSSPPLRAGRSEEETNMPFQVSDPDEEP